MKMKALKYIAAVAVVGLASCQNNDLDLGSYNSNPNAVHITATVCNTLTRSFPTEDTGIENGLATQFNVGDKISVSNNYQESAVYEFNGTNWNPVFPDIYLTWSSNKQHFTAYYPETYNGSYDVPQDQTTEKLIAAADYMKFDGQFEKSETVSFEMERQTARFIISGIDWGRQYVENNVATHTIEEIRFSCIGTKDIKPLEKNGKYYVLLNPGDAANDTFITITLKSKKDNSITTETVSGIPALAAGTSYNCVLIIGKNKAELGKVTLEDWGYGNHLGDGIAKDGYVVYETSDGYTAYDIHTLSGLLEVNQILTAPDVTAEMLKAHITLYADFELPAVKPGETSNWKTIGSDEYKPFKGHFDGNGHFIKGLVVESTAAYQGLLGYATNKVSNLTLIGCKVKGDGYVGGIAGFSYSKFSNCKVIATEDYPVVIESTNEYVGGMIGRNDFGEISNCSVIADGGSVTIKSTGNSLGGFIGGNGSGQISNCHVKTANKGTISITGSSYSQNVGGFVGYSHYSNASISDCSVNNENGTISITNSDNANTGGFVGRNEQTISNCNVTGATITGKANVGGFVGLVYEYDATITGTNKVRNCIITGNDGSTNSNYGKLEEIYKIINIDADNSNTVIKR